MSQKSNDKDSRDLRRQYRNTDFRAFEDSGGKLILGHAAVFEQMTEIGCWYKEIIERGAFDECNFDDVLFFTNHQARKIPMARSRRNNGSSTMKLSIDEKGLYIEAKIDTENNVEARQVYSSIERGDLTGMSFAFSVKEDAWEDLDSDMPTRRIKKIARVYEVSAVNEPAYEDTDIYVRDKTTLENVRLALEKAKEKRDLYKIKNEILGGL